MVARKGQRRGQRPYKPIESEGPADVANKVERDLQAQYGVSRAVDYAHGRAAQAEAARTMSTEEAAAILKARAGDDTDLFPYTPTPSINPPRPRTQAAGYSADTQTLRVKFRDGAVYEYYDVPPNVWRNFQRVKSPGRAINRTLNAFSYARRPDLEA
jgi:hypothetical protein